MVLGRVVSKIHDVEIDNNSVFRFVVISGGQFLTQPHIISNITTIKRKSILNDSFLNMSMSSTSRSPSLFGIKLDLSLLEHHLNDQNNNILVAKVHNHFPFHLFQFSSYRSISDRLSLDLLSLCL